MRGWSGMVKSFPKNDNWCYMMRFLEGIIAYCYDEAQGCGSALLKNGMTPTWPIANEDGKRACLFNSHDSKSRQQLQQDVQGWMCDLSRILVHTLSGCKALWEMRSRNLLLSRGKPDEESMDENDL